MAVKDGVDRKRGKLSNEETEFIRNNAATMSMEEIAAHLSRTIDPIRRYIAEQSLEVNTENKDRVLIKRRLNAEFFWKITKDQLNKEEQDYFANAWVELIEQFNEDVLPSEKQQIKQLILSEIYKNRAGIDLRRCYDDIESFGEKLRKEENTVSPDMQLMDYYRTQISQAKANIQALTMQIKEYGKVSQDLQKDLKATRDQRFKTIENASTTFMSIIKSLAEKDERETQSKELELMRLATDKAQDKLYEYTTYIDGTEDQPILCAEALEYQDKKQQGTKE